MATKVVVRRQMVNDLFGRNPEILPQRCTDRGLKLKFQPVSCQS